MSTKTVIVGVYDEGAYFVEGDHDEVEDSSSAFAVDVPADLIDTYYQAKKVEAAALNAVLAAAGLDEEMGRLVACCSRWTGDFNPGTSWWRLVVPASGDDLTWPLHDAAIHHAPTEAELQSFVVELPDQFWVLNGQMWSVQRDRLEIQPGGIAPSVTACFRCGWPRDEHADHGAPVES